MLLTASFAALLVLVGASTGGAAKPGGLQAVSVPAVQPKEFKGDVRALKPVASKKRAGFEGRLPGRRKAPSGAVSVGSSVVAAAAPSPSRSFSGVKFADICGSGLCGAGWPPDTVIDVGPNHVVEAVNTAIGIFSKTGTRLAAFTFDSLWAAANSGTPCDSSNFGDVTVVYDQLADRWIVSDLGFNLDSSLTTPVPPFYECIAVSRTGDPVGGGWYLYPVRVDSGVPGAPPSGYLNDYPKMGLWPDALYMTANEFDMNVPTQPYKGVAFWAFDRAALESGQPLRQLVAFNASSIDPVSVLPANLRGASPPAGTPEYLVSESATSYNWEVRTFTVSWSGTPSGTVSAAANVSQAQYVVGSGAIVPQPADPYGTRKALDAIDDRPIMQAQYRNIGGRESLWVAHTVRTSTTSPTALQWAQLDVTGRTIAASPVQQQIFTNGGDGLWRWLPSLAVDASGDMAVGYSVSSSTVYPAIRYAGRLVGDPLGTLPQSEVTLRTGAGSQTVSDRWGDYSAMTVDPTDDCTFWYANEYYGTAYDGAVLYAQWSTWIGAFKFPTCSSTPTTGRLQGTVTDASTSSPLAGATVSVSGGASTTTDLSGFYSFSSVAAGSYSVSASKAGYTTSTANGVVVNAGQTTTQDFALTPSPATGTLQGTVTDASTSSPLAGATVSVSGGASTTTDSSGFYSFSSVAAGSYSVSASKAGYTTSTVNNVAVTAGQTTTQDFALAAPQPTITSFSPTRGRVGQSVTINGTNLLTTRSVVFNTTAATSFTVVSATQVKATVPTGATTGPIHVTTSGGTANSTSSFRVR